MSNRVCKITKLVRFFLFFYFYGQNLSTRITKGNNKQVSILCLHIENKQKTPALVASGFSLRVGGDLLSHSVCSIIGAAGLNFSVRNGKRCAPAQ